MNSLPLSWSLLNSEVRYSKTISRWNIKWLALQNVSKSMFISEVEKGLSKYYDTILRGCNSKLVNKLEDVGFSSIQIGMEAVLDTRKDHFNKDSLKKILKRGKRHGRVMKIPYSEKNMLKLNDFQKLSVHGAEPQLKHLFQTEYKENNLLYIFTDFNKKWLGAILLSKNSINKLHTELILRHPKAPIGIMEVLVEFIFNKAKKQNFRYLSLGEVPFTANDIGLLKIKSWFTVKTGRLLNFAYNYKGLYNFKNKFQPNWEKLYICSSTKVKLKHLFFIFFHSNFHKLIVYKLLYSLKNIILLKFMNTL